MLTEPAFNALLKTLEEPPAHVVFILCTTDAQKIPLTVIGRCQQFVFRRHSEEQIIARLTHIAKAEKVAVDPEAMKLIARTAQGSMRDAVGLLDQLVPLASGPISLESARSLQQTVSSAFREQQARPHPLGGRRRRSAAPEGGRVKRQPRRLYRPQPPVAPASPQPGISAPRDAGPHHPDAAAHRAPTTDGARSPDRAWRAPPPTGLDNLPSVPARPVSAPHPTHTCG